MIKILFPGTFDPFTKGHHCLIHRAIKMFGSNDIELTIGIANNTSKKTMFTIDSRIEAINSYCKYWNKFYSCPDQNIKLNCVPYFEMTMDFAVTNHYNMILRGIRNTIDFEYEKTIANTNFFTKDIDTIFLMDTTSSFPISSSLVREFINFGKEYNHLIPEGYDLCLLDFNKD